MKTLRRTTLSAFAAAVALMSGVHCGDGETTGRARVTFPVRVRGINPESDNALGWHVTVEQAHLSLGPLRWYEGAPIFGRRRVPAVSFGLAHAHPGHYVAGEALADTTSRRTVDLMTTTELDVATGVTGTALSATVELRPPAGALGPAEAPLQGATLWVRGVARREGAEVRFEGGVAVDTAVSGIPARGVIGPEGSFTLSVDLAQWFDRADFSTLTAPGGDARAVVPMTGEVANALYRGVTNGAGFLFAWTAAPEGPVTRGQGQ